VPDEYANFLVGHELGHVLLAELRYKGPDEEAFADLIGAALVAPKPAISAFYRKYGFDVKSIAEESSSTQTWAALRLGEVISMPLVAITKKTVRVRGSRTYAWPAEPTLRTWALEPATRPGLRKISISDDRERTVLVADVA
jgi:hypothetical protein